MARICSTILSSASNTPSFSLILLDGISSNSCGRVGQLVDLVSHLGHGCVNLLLMLHECRFDDTVVDEFWSIPGDWHEAPYQEQALSQPVEWEPWQEQIREEFTNREQGKDNPVGQPACVIFFPHRFQGFDTAVCRVDKSNGIADQLSTPSEDQIHTC